jgi:hypothetical protein
VTEHNKKTFLLVGGSRDGERFEMMTDKDGIPLNSLSFSKSIPNKNNDLRGRLVQFTKQVFAKEIYEIAPFFFRDKSPPVIVYAVKGMTVRQVLEKLVKGYQAHD